jgi:acylphosphatase
MEEKLLYKISIYGRVQGVGFRWNAANEARSIGINGFIKNLPDGSVYIEAEGSTSQLNIFVEWCKRGPARGSVETINVDKLPPLYYTEFRIES